ncbi:MAG: M12 family metallopeptidase [bacterium]|nr:M12 family metallopeptidase [bacterium]
MKIAFLTLLLTVTVAKAQPQSPSVVPPVSPPLLERAAHDPSPDPPLEPTLPPPPMPSELDAAPPDAAVAPPEGELVTEGFEVRGCVQVPIFGERGPYTQALPWPFGVIPFEFDANVSQANRDLFQNAMNEVRDYCGVTFRSRNQFDGAWLHVQLSTANNAPIGFFLGQHTVNIINFNVHYIMVHELFHIIGIYHEQSRTDRDNFVTINTGNISQSACGGPCNFNFQIETDAAIHGAYNFDSFMHYGRTAFSISAADTITVQPAFAGVWQTRIGQRTHATFADRSTAIRLYQPSWAKIARINSNPNGPGTWNSPYNNYPDAYNAAPDGGDVLILSGYYTGLGRWGSPRRVHAPDGGVRIGQ